MFTYTPGATNAGGQVDSYTLTAQPTSLNQGRKFYFTSEDGVIHWNDGSAATATSSAL
jgi:hypothetical protein